MVKIPQGLQDGEKITLKSEGFHLVNSSSKGDHILTVKIDIPKSLTSEQRSLYEKLRAIGQ
jgi:DnaJ-class molecular chaperone